LPRLAKLKVLQCLPNPEANSPTNEKYYEDKKGLKQYVCGLKPHGEMTFKEKVLNYFILCGTSNSFHYLVGGV
jgi:hypothetical protein